MSIVPLQVQKRAYKFDETGNLLQSESEDWNICEDVGVGSAFNWYHVQLPRERHEPWLESQSLTPHLCPPMTQNEIMELVHNGRVCDNFNEALIFGIDFSSQGSSDFPLRIAVWVTHNRIITVSWGRVPRLNFKRIEGLLNEADAGGDEEAGGDEQAGDNEVVGDSQYSEVGWCQHVPNRIAGLLVRIIYSYAYHIQLALSELETEISSLELVWNYGNSRKKKEILKGRRCSIMQVDLQQLIRQVSDYSEQVFPILREKCTAKIWFTGEDSATFEKQIHCLKVLKGKLDLLLGRADRVHEGLRRWQADNWNRTVYLSTLCTILVLPTGSLSTLFGVNVGGLPWKEDPHGFIWVLLIGAAITVVLLILFTLGRRGES